MIELIEQNHKTTLNKNDYNVNIDKRSQEKEIVERIQFLELQDRMLDEQTEMRDKAEKELAETLRYLQARDRQSREEARQRERLTALKQEEERERPKNGTVI